MANKQSKYILETIRRDKIEFKHYAQAWKAWHTCPVTASLWEQIPGQTIRSSPRYRCIEYKIVFSEAQIQRMKLSWIEKYLIEEKEHLEEKTKNRMNRRLSKMAA